MCFGLCLESLICPTFTHLFHEPVIYLEQIGSAQKSKNSSAFTIRNSGEKIGEKIKEKESFPSRIFHVSVYCAALFTENVNSCADSLRRSAPRAPAVARGSTGDSTNIATNIATTNRLPGDFGALLMRRWVQSP